MSERAGRPWCEAGERCLRSVVPDREVKRRASHRRLAQPSSGASISKTWAGPLAGERYHLGSSARSSWPGGWRLGDNSFPAPNPRAEAGTVNCTSQERQRSGHRFDYQACESCSCGAS